MSDLYINNVWHRYSRDTYKSITGTLSANYSGLRLNVSFSGSTFSNYKLSGGGYPDTGNQDTIRIFIDGEQVAETKVGMNSSTPNIYISGYRDVSTTSHNVSMTIQCGDYISCPYNYYHNPCNLGNISMPSPYTQPTEYALTVTPNIGRIREVLESGTVISGTEFSGSQSITLGAGSNLSDVKLLLFPNVSWSYGRWDNVSSNIKNSVISTFDAPTSTSGTTKFILDYTKFTDGASYKVAIRFSDGHYYWISGDDDTIYTYEKPIMTQLTNFTQPFSPQDGKTLKWKTNSRRWKNLENEFVTRVLNNDDQTKSLNNAPQEPKYSTSNSYTEATPSIPLNKNTINELFSDDARSVGLMDGTIRVDRTNNSEGAGYRAVGTTTIQVQYQPTKSPTNGTVTYNNKSISRNTVFIQDIPTIDIDWSYPITSGAAGSGAAGVVDGYILRVYSDSSYTQQYGIDKVIQVTQNASNAKWKLNTKTELKRGVLNYLKITPYYDKPNGTGKIEGQKSLQMALVTPISRINTPVIEYPINNSNWHNKNFRILLQLPSDDDISELGLSNDEYRYQDIELKITPNNMSANAVTYSFKNNPEIFSTDTLSHTKKIAINPSVLDTLPNASTYKLELRVQKNYYITTGENSYSKWSTAVIVKNTALNNLNLTSGQEIELSHYDYVRNASVRLHDTYPIYTLNSNNVSQKVGDQIDYKEYDGMITDILNIQKGVNEYCSYDQDRNAIKFKNTINTLNGEQEYITAELEGTEIDGRNYMNILINEMNKLI